MIVQQHHGVRFGSAAALPASLLATLALHLQCSAAAPAGGALDGRVRPDFLHLPGPGAVVVKHYVRGGWMRFVSRRCYLRTARSRGRTEYEMLHLLGTLGFDVPRPVAWAERGSLWVHAWLIMEELPGVLTLARIARDDPERARALLSGVGEMVARLVDHRIHHVDFHPGNILVDSDDHLHPIDFDKAARVTCPAPELAQRYERRWQRAVAKHRLPAWLGEELRLAV